MKSQKTTGRTITKLLILLVLVFSATTIISAQKFSDNAEVQKAMEQGESAFLKKNYDEAIKFYKTALNLESTNYYAALFIGDMYFRKNDFDDAETWFQKAIVIDPNIETAYRYSATPLMKQKKYDLARDRYIEAYITEPYNKRTTDTLVNWGKITKTKLGHPKMNIPTFKVGADGKAESTISLSLPGLGGNDDDDPAALSWIAYTSTRTEWLDKKFAKTFPNEKKYRHTLMEETEALRSVAELAKSLSKKKKASPEFRTLIELNEKGLLEAYILLAVADQGIAQDHGGYLRSNRAKLRQYVMEYVVGKK